MAFRPSKIFSLVLINFYLYFKSTAATLFLMDTEKSIDAIFENLDIFDLREGAVDMKPITIWVPLKYKIDYDKLQMSTRNKFGKKLKEVIMKSIEKMDAMKRLESIKRLEKGPRA